MNFDHEDDNEQRGDGHQSPPFGRRSSDQAPHFPSPIAAFLLAFASIFATLMVTLLFGGLFDNEPNYGVLGVGHALGLGLVATLAARSVPEPHAERMGLCGFSPALIPTLLLLLPLVVVTSEIDNWLMQLRPPPSEDLEALREMMREIVGDQTRLALAQIAIIKVGLEPVVQEFLFRGVIQQGVVAHFARALGTTAGRVVGILVTATLWGLCQMDPTRPESAFAVALLAGTALGIVRIATGSILAPIALHAAWNAIGVALTGASEVLPIDGLNVPDTHSAPELVALSAAAVASGLFVMWKAMGEIPAALPVPPPKPPEFD